MQASLAVGETWELEWRSTVSKSVQPSVEYTNAIGLAHHSVPAVPGRQRLDAQTEWTGYAADALVVKSCQAEVTLDIAGTSIANVNNAVDTAAPGEAVAFTVVMKIPEATDLYSLVFDTGAGTALHNYRLIGGESTVLALA